LKRTLRESSRVHEPFHGVNERTPPKLEREDLTAPSALCAVRTAERRGCLCSPCPRGTGASDRACFAAVCCAHRRSLYGFLSKTSRPIGTAVVRPHVVVSLSVKHWCPGNWAPVGKLAVPADASAAAGVANATECYRLSATRSLYSGLPTHCVRSNAPGCASTASAAAGRTVRFGLARVPCCL